MRHGSGRQVEKERKREKNELRRINLRTHLHADSKTEEKQ